MPTENSTVSWVNVLDQAMSDAPTPPPMPPLSTPIPAPFDVNSIIQSLSNDSEYEETIDDYRIKYDHCFGTINDNLIKAIDFFYDDHADENVVSYSTYLSSGWVDDTSNISFMDNIDWTLPKLGCINVRDTVIYFKRRHKQNSPTRYRKGFRFDSLDMFEPNSKEYHILGKELFRHDSNSKTDILNSLFFPEKYSVEEALDSVLSLDRLGTSFNNDYYFTLSSSINSFLLWRNNVIVGIYSKTSKRFKVTTPLFNKELSEIGIMTEAA